MPVLLDGAQARRRGVAATTHRRNERHARGALRVLVDGERARGAGAHVGGRDRALRCALWLARGPCEAHRDELRDARGRGVAAAGRGAACSMLLGRAPSVATTRRIWASGARTVLRRQYLCGAGHVAVAMHICRVRRRDGRGPRRDDIRPAGAVAAAGVHRACVCTDVHACGARPFWGAGDHVRCDDGAAGIGS